MVGGTKGESELHLSSHSIHASSIGREKNAVEIKSTRTTMDNFVSTAPIPSPHVIKLDIEGEEVLALSETKMRFADHQPSLVFESNENMYRFRYSPKDVLNLIRSLGSYDFFFMNSANCQPIPITHSHVSDAYTDILAKPRRTKK